MKQSETPWALKHTILELQTEVEQLRLKLDEKTTNQKMGPKTRLVAGHAEIAPFEDIAAMGIVSSGDASYVVRLARRGGGNYANIGLWLGESHQTNNRIPEVRVDNQRQWVLVFVKPSKTPASSRPVVATTVDEVFPTPRPEERERVGA